MKTVLFCILFLVFAVACPSSALADDADDLLDAAFRDDIGQVKTLLEKGTDVNAKDADGVTVLWMAAQNGHTEIVKVLLDKGADVNKRRTDGVTALWQAAWLGHTQIVKALLDKGADVNIKRRTDGATALMMAAQEGHLEIVKLLLESKADVNAANKTNGVTPLFMGAVKGHTEIVKLLLAAEADVNAKASKAGKDYTPLSIAKEMGHTQIIKLLKEYGAKDEEQKSLSHSGQSQEIRASHILIATAKLDEKGKANAKARIEELLRKIRSGASFEELARKHSDCPSKVNGGDLGYFKRGTMVKGFEDAAFALKVGEVSDVIETSYGYHIIQVTDRRQLSETKLPHKEEKEPREYESPWGITFVIENVAGTSDQLLRVKGTKLSARATAPMLLVNSKFPVRHIAENLADHHLKASLNNGELWASFTPSSDRLFLAYKTTGKINWFGHDLSGKIVLLSSLAPNGKVKKWYFNAGGRGATLQGLKSVDVQGWTEINLLSTTKSHPGSGKILESSPWSKKLILHTGANQKSGKKFSVHVWEGTTYTGDDGIPTGRTHRYRVKGYLAATKPTTDNPFMSELSGEIVALTIEKTE